MQAADEGWRRVLFLVDTGADQTVLSADVLADPALAAMPAAVAVEGAGGQVNTAALDTQLRLTCDAGMHVVFKGQFAASVDHHSLDMSVLGRDITNHFALLVDRAQEVVCLVGQRHRCVVEPCQRHRIIESCTAGIIPGDSRRHLLAYSRPP